MFVLKLLEKLMEKCPINYSLIQNAICVDPKYMVKNNTKAHSKLKNVLLYLSQKGQIAEEECDNILLEYADFIKNVAQTSLSEFKSYDARKTRLDTFLHSFISNKYCKLWEVFKTVFILSHGQASVERGFSINKQIEVENLGENSYIAQRIVCDSVKHVGGILSVVVTKEMRMAASSAHSQYRMYLEEQKKKETLEITKRKCEASDDVISLKERKTLIEKEIESLDKRANELAQKAVLSKDFELLNKSNELLKTVCEKQTQLREIDSNIGEKKKKKN